MIGLDKYFNLFSRVIMTYDSALQGKLIVAQAALINYLKVNYLLNVNIK